MKKIMLAITAVVVSATLFAQTNTTAVKKAEDVIKFKELSHNFGKIKHNVPVTYFFEFKNISDKPLVVENASASCGCTVPERPEKPIMPGETGKLKVQFNAAAVGPISKDVYVKFAGIEQTKTLKITGEVLAD